jgi:hypothetical protein
MNIGWISFGNGIEAVGVDHNAFLFDLCESTIELSRL